ncbi:MAG: transporter EcsB [Paenibacillaceae bacterium]|nr:transporter EcsB [Paenibacillaceae bacterium]
MSEKRFASNASIALIYRDRAQSYRRFVGQYLRYVFSSGFALLLGGLGMAGWYYYSGWIRAFPADFPLAWLALAALGPIWAFCPQRGYLQRADLVFLLPMEDRMPQYFRPMLIGGTVRQSIAVLVVWLLLYPLDRLYEAERGYDVNVLFFAAAAVVFLALKTTLYWGAFKERRIRSERVRRVFQLVRWGLAFVWGYTFVALAHSWWVLLVAGTAVLYMILLRLPARDFVHWERWVRLEQAAMSRTYTFLNAFVDLPRDEEKALPARSWLGFLGDGLPLRRERAYEYLYIKTLMRSDLLGLLFRQCLVFAALETLSTSLWLKVGLLAAGVVMTGAQLKALEREHVRVHWVHVYPLPEEWRMTAAVSVIRRAHAVCVLVLGLPLWWADAAPAAPLAAWVAGLGFVWLSSWRFAVRRR